MQKLPIGIQHFNVLREEGYLYVDKTEHIHRLMQAGKFLFLSRPRRFGKSLLLTTLQEIYRGNRTLFNGLWIEDKIDWQPRPVILINFNDMEFHKQSLSEALAHQLDRIAVQHRITLQAENFKDKFYELIATLAQHRQDTNGNGTSKVVLLVDEYDKPITDLLENEQKVTEHIAILKSFYSVLKSTASEYIHFALLTGVSKYGKISVFSDLNNLIDVSLDQQFATLLGYTQEELEHYFAEHIDRLAETFAASRSETLQQIRHWYNGYSWDGKQTVYVPFSTMVFLEKQTFENHWFSTGTPSFLIHLLRKNQLAAYELRELISDDKLLSSTTVENIGALAIMFQTGYLTVKEMKSTFKGREYRLGYPNHEVEQSFQHYLLADYLHRPVEQLDSTLLNRLRKALQQGEIEDFVAILNAQFATIPHTIHLPFEAYYHSLIYLILNLLGFTVHPEKVMSQGRIDAVLELPDRIYILEFKMSSAQVALDQIKARGYDQPYRASGKPITLLGIAFDKEKRAIGNWQTESQP